MDAVVRTGGKQYRVHEGSVLNVANLDAEPGSQVELRDVLLVSDGDSVTVGSPNVPDAMVVAEVVEHGRDAKVINFRYKAKTRFRRKHGHRQGYTTLSIREIRFGETSSTSRTAPRRRARTEEPPSAEEPAAETTAEAPATTRRRSRSRSGGETPASESASEGQTTRRRRTRQQSEEESSGGFAGREE